jgi:hypothetical protein
MTALSQRTREIEADEREAASALILGTCAAHGLAFCDATPRCEGLVPGQGFAMYCAGPGYVAHKCTTVDAFADAQRHPVTIAEAAERTPVNADVAARMRAQRLIVEPVDWPAIHARVAEAQRRNGPYTHAIDTERAPRPRS